MAQSKVFTGIIWASVQRFGGLAISFVSNMILARLLTPDDFGTIGMLMFFLALAQTFVDSGFGAALIQKKDSDQTDASTVFFINMALSVLLYLALFIGAPFIANFYGNEKLCGLLRVMGLVVIIQGITLIQTTLLMKRLEFKLLSICNLTGALILAIVGIVSAYLGCGVWSFVIRALAGAAVTSIMLWALSKWRPLLVFRKESAKQLFSFGGFMLMSSLMITMSQNIQSMIIGKMFTPSVLGNFTQARTLRNLSSESISTVINQVLFPDFSNHQDDHALIKQRLEKSAYIISYAVASLMGFMILCGRPLINICYGGQWDEAIPYFKIFCIGALPVCLQDININVIKAKGRSKALFFINLVKLVVYIVMMVIGAKLWGIYGLIWVMVVYALLGYVIFAYYGTRLIGCTIFGQLLGILKSLAIVAVPFALVEALNRFAVDNLPYLLWIAVDTLAFFAIFLIVSHISKCEPYQYLLTNVKERIHKKK